MGRNNSYNLNLKELTDAEVYLAIRYLDPDEPRDNGDDRRSMTMISILILVLGFVGLFFCLYQCSH
jgi:hypothetical protein